MSTGTFRRAIDPVLRDGGLVLLCLLVIWSLWLLVHPLFRSPPPTERDWAAAAARVKADLQDGDGIRIEPAWATGGRVWFGDLDGGPARPFRILDVHEKIDAPWLARFSRVWVVGAMGYGARAEDALRSVGFEPALQEELGDLVVYRFDGAPGRVPWSLPEDLMTLQVSATMDGEEVACDDRRQVVRCGPRNRLRKATKRAAGSDRQCLLLGANEKGGLETLKLEFHAPAAGVLHLGLSHTLDAARLRAGSDVNIRVEAGDESRAEELERGSYHRLTFSIPVEAPGPVSLFLVPEEPPLQQLCLQATLIELAPH